MLEKYQHIIYENKADRAKVIKTCIDRVLEYNPDRTKDEVLASIEQKKADILNYMFQEELMTAEGEKLFTIVVERFGNKIWRSAEKPRNCKKFCPFGDMCKMYFVEIENEQLCYGQLLYKGIGEKELLCIAKEKRVRILKSDGEVFVDMSNPDCSDYDLENQSAYFFDHILHIMQFGEKGIGDKIIAQL